MLLFVNQLTNVDFSFLDPERGLLGETYLANLNLDGDLDEQGMVCDFGVVKKRVRQWLDDELDHRLAIPTLSPNIKIEFINDSIKVDWQFGKNYCLSTTGPKSAFALIDTDVLTPDSIAAWCKKNLRQLFAEIKVDLALSFVPEKIDGAYYHYSHGLKKHGGNCQRIAHGHRSRIHVWKNAQVALELETELAQLWKDIYVGTREDIIEQLEINQQKYLRFAYQSQQGYFEITLPEVVCYLIDTDSTVEFIAQHFAHYLKQKHPQDKIRVQAFEGFCKGALVEI